MARHSVSLNERHPSKKTYEVSSVRKALQILRSFTAHTPCWRLSELSQLLRMPKSTLHNLLRTLEQFEFVRQDAKGKQYRLGPGIYELGLLFHRSTGMIANAMPHLRQLAEQTGETVKLGLLSGGRVLVVAAIESSYQLHTRGDVGCLWPLHSTSLGKAILAVLSPLEVSVIIGRHGLPRLTDRTIAVPRALERCLREIRNQHYALDIEENEAGVVCIAVPLPAPVGGTPASVSVSGPSVRLSVRQLRDWAPLLADTAGSIAADVPLPLSVEQVKSGARKSRAPVH